MSFSVLFQLISIKIVLCFQALVRILSAWSHQRSIKGLGKRTYFHLSKFPQSCLPRYAHKTRDGILTLEEKGLTQRVHYGTRLPRTHWRVSTHSWNLYTHNTQRKLRTGGNVMLTHRTQMTLSNGVWREVKDRTHIILNTVKWWAFTHRTQSRMSKEWLENAEQRDIDDWVLIGDLHSPKRLRINWIMTG